METIFDMIEEIKHVARVKNLTFADAALAYKTWYELFCK